MESAEQMNDQESLRDSTLVGDQMINEEENMDIRKESAIELDPSTEESKQLPLGPPPNGGYGWVVVIASFFIHVLVLGNVYSFGVYQAEYVDVFNANAASIAWIGSIGSALMVAIGSYTGAFADQYGNGIGVFVGAVFTAIGYLVASFSTEVWHLYLTQGLICGVGYSFAFIAGVSVVGQWFTSRRGMAVGIAVAGSGLGQFSIVLLTGNLITSYGWRTSLQIMSLITFVGLTVCSFLIRRYLPCVKPKHTESSLIFFQDRKFVLIFIGGLIGGLGTIMPYVYIPTYGKRYGISLSQSILILSLMGLASLAGRIILGFGGDYLGKLPMVIVCYFVAGIAILGWMGCKSFGTLLVFGLVYGFFSGGVISLLPAVVAELFGLAKISSIIGLLYSSTAVGNLLSAPIGGFLFVATGSFFASQAVAAAFLIIGSFFSFLALLVVQAEKAKNELVPQSDSEKLEKGSDGNDSDVESNNNESGYELISHNQEGKQVL